MPDTLDTAGAVAGYLNNETTPAQLGAQARYSMANAVGGNSTYEAELRGVAQRTGVPVDTVRSYPDEMKKQATLGAYDFDKLAVEFPGTTKFLVDQDKAAVGHDDTGTLKALESAVKYLVSAPGAGSTLGGDLKGGLYGANSGLAGAFGAVARTAGAPLDWLDNTPMPGGNPLRRLSEGFMSIADTDAAAQKAASGKSGTWLGGAVSSGVQSLSQNLLMMPMALLPGGQAATLTGMASMAGGQSYQKDMADGVPHWKSLIHGVSDGVIEAGTEMMPLGNLVHEVKAGTPLFTTILKNAWAENKGEQIATALQDLNDWAINDVNKGKTFGDYLAARPEAAAQTLIATLIGAGGNVTLMHGVQGAVDRTVGFDRQAQAAEQHAQVLEAMQTTMQASKLLEHSPDTLRSYAQDLADEGVPLVYVDSAKLVEAGVDLQALAQAVPSVAAQLQQAEFGGDLAIPTGELLTNTIGTEFAQSLIDHARTDVNGMSRIEAKTYMDQQGDHIHAEIERVMTEKGNDTEFKAGRDQVQAQILTQLNDIKRFTGKVNEQYATLAANFYAVMAARTGMSVQQFADTYKLGFNANEVAGGTYDQGGKLGGVKAQWADSGVTGDISEKDGVITLSRIVVPKEERGSGTGTAAMQALVDYADRTGQHVALSPSADFGGNKKRLLAFYKRFGFIENKGKNRAFTTSESMYRLSEGKVLYQDKRGQIAFGNDITQEASIISLLKNADLSTFVHESGHFFLEVQTDLANRIAARIAQGEQVSDDERSILDDMNKTLDWMGVKATPEMSALDHWAYLSAEEKRPHHEQWARGFEAYAFEGKAPSLDLQHAFQTFRAWLVNVYRALLKSVNGSKTDIAGAMKVELSDEVRSVMDRMLATSDQIAEAEAARTMGPLFKTAEEAGMTLDEFKAYHDQGTQATMDAVDELQARGLRDMQWLHNARSRKLKELQKQHDALRAQVTREVRGEVMAQPIYRAWTFLTSKAESKALPGVTDLVTADLSQASGKLRTQVLRDAYGTADDAVWRKLSALRMTSDETGLHPDLVGELFGFGSGDELVKTLAETEPPKSVIEGMVDTRMLQEHGDLATPAGLERAADAAIHNDARAKFVATELKALQKAMSVREKVPGQKNTVDVLARAARDYATAIIAKLKVRDIRPGQYAAAEVRSAKAAAKAVGDIAQATLHKRNQLINLYATKAAYAAQEEVKKTIGYFKKFDSASVRAKLPADYLGQIDMLLEKFDLRAQSNTAVDRTKSLRTWVQSRLNAGEIPNISESLLTPEERKAYSAAINARDDEGNLVYPDDDERTKLLADAIERSTKRSIKDMTVEEVRGLRETIAQIEHLGRLKDKMLTAMEGAGYAATRDLLTATVVANAKESGKNTRTDNTLVGSKLDGLKQFGASHIKPAIWMRIFDGGKDNGPWWSTIVRPANERATFETSRRAKATRELMDILAPVLKNVSHLDKIGKGRLFPELGKDSAGKGVSLNWEERMAFAFNYGNESNLQRLMGGGIAGVTKSLSMGQVQAVLKTLSAAEWTAVQGVWDHFESYRPEIAAKELRVNGVEPVWIDARPFSIKTSDGQTLALRGGYFPVKFDAQTSLKAQQHSDAQSAKDAMKAAYSAATTQRSFTKARVEEVTGRPLLLNLRGLYTGINDVIHDLAWHEWVVDVNQLLRSDTVDAAIREHYGANVKRELTKWRDDIVAGSARLDHGLENAAGWARKFVSSAALTYNVISALMQPLGITQSFARVGTRWVGMGLGQYLSNPVAATKMVQGKSEYMTNRTRTMFRDVNELRNRVDGQTTGRELMGRYGYYLTMHMQMTVDVPTWIGAYEKGLAEGHADDVAIALADQSVKDSQGGGEEVDQSGITRGGPMVKLFTAFYDFMNTQANVLYLKNATATDRADKFMHMAVVGLVTPLLGAALRDALIAGDSGDWDDWEKILKKLLSEGLSNLVGMVAFGREFSQAAKALYGDDKGISYSGPTGLRVIPDVGKLAKQLHQGEMDEAFRKSFINVVGDVAGIPAVQINRTINGIEALHDGKTQNPFAVVSGYQEPH
jgi:GNAT superfamily N-acetyltransferase